MRRTKEEAEETRQQLLSAALEVFANKGYEATRLSDIADAAGLTRGTIYWHFENKADLFRKLIADHIDPFVLLINKIFERKLPPLETLRQILLQVPAAIKNNKKIADSQKLSFLKMRMNSSIRPLDEVFQDKFQRVFERLCGLIRRGQGAGEIVMRNVEVIATVIATYLMGTAAALLEAGTDIVDVEKNLEGLVELVVRGIRA